MTELNGFAGCRKEIQAGYRAMKSDPDKLLNQLVVAAVTVFIVVIMLLAALVLRQFWLQQRLADLSSEVQVSLDDLEEITEDIQRELVESRTTINEAENIDNWQEVTEALDDVDEQLDSIGENLEDLNEASLALEPPADATSALTGANEQTDATQDQVDQVFTIFVILVGVASIAIAILLGMAVRIHQSALYSEGHRS
jgi:ABC-type multidrug transport system fused ATPase/permease subunit